MILLESIGAGVPKSWPNWLCLVMLALFDAVSAQNDLKMEWPEPDGFWPVREGDFSTYVERRCDGFHGTFYTSKRGQNTTKNYGYFESGAGYKMKLWPGIVDDEIVVVQPHPRSDGFWIHLVERSEMALYIALDEGEMIYDSDLPFLYDKYFFTSSLIAWDLGKLIRDSNDKRAKIDYMSIAISPTKREISAHCFSGLEYCARNFDQPNSIVRRKDRQIIWQMHGISMFVECGMGGHGENNRCHFYLAHANGTNWYFPQDLRVGDEGLAGTRTMLFPIARADDPFFGKQPEEGDFTVTSSNSGTSTTTSSTTTTTGPTSTTTTESTPNSTFASITTLDPQTTEIRVISSRDPRPRTNGASSTVTPSILLFSLVWWRVVCWCGVSNSAVF